jgi:hypothetical protein
VQHHGFFAVGAYHGAWQLRLAGEPDPTTRPGGSAGQYLIIFTTTQLIINAFVSLSLFVCSYIGWLI